jgi:hypothetical protein
MNITAAVFGSTPAFEREANMIRDIFFLSLLLLLLIVTPARAVEFDHAAHLDVLGEEAVCVTCHLDTADTIKPEGAVCRECHEEDFIGEVQFPGLKTHGPVWALNHRPYAKNKASDCESCHRQGDCLDCHKAGFADEMGEFTNNMINVHRSDFHVTHPIAARTDPQLCSSCHEPQFCSDCHNDFAPADLAILSHRRGWSDLTISSSAGAPIHAQFTEAQCATCHPDSVLPAHDWSSRHAREARKNLATCQACHPEGNVCLTCHSAVSGLRVNPHPGDWGSIMDNLNKASDGKTCRKCH